MMQAKTIVAAVTSLLLVFGGPATVAAGPDDQAPASLTEESSREPSATSDVSASSVQYPRPGRCPPCPKIERTVEREGNCLGEYVASNTGQNPYTCECRYGRRTEVGRVCDDPANIC